MSFWLVMWSNSCANPCGALRRGSVQVRGGEPVPVGTSALRYLAIRSIRAQPPYHIECTNKARKNSRGP